MIVAQIRKASEVTAKRLGYATNSQLPLLDQDLILRPRQDIVSRALALHCVVASSYGFPKHRNLEWLRQENLANMLTAEESVFLNSPARHAPQFQVQGECLWVFAWVFGRVEHLDFTQPAAEYLVTLYPDLKKSESSAQWQTNISLRSQNDILTACDLAYCLHWAINQSQLDPRTQVGSVKPYVIVERRRALEWMLGREKWSEVSLDT